MNVDGRAERPILEWGFTSFPFALSIHDEELRCLAVNDRMCGMFSVSEEALRGRRMTDVLGPRFRSLLAGRVAHDLPGQHLVQILPPEKPIR